MESLLEDCKIAVDQRSQIITVTWGHCLSFETACSFMLSYNQHKKYPGYGLLLDFRQVDDLQMLINDLMRLAEIATRIFDVGSVVRTAFLISNADQQNRVDQYVQLRQMLSKRELQFDRFFEEKEARRWLTANN